MREQRGRSEYEALLIRESLVPLQIACQMSNVVRRLTRVSALGKDSRVCPKMAMNASSFASAAVRSTSSQDHDEARQIPAQFFDAFTCR